MRVVPITRPTSRDPTHNDRLLSHLLFNDKAFSSTGSGDVDVALPVS